MDDRLGVFMSDRGPEIFHSVQHSQDVWCEDPFDVPEIHEKARVAFGRLVERSRSGDRQAGRILLLKGEAGSGKTHLLRAFRASVHRDESAFFAYMQMTSSATIQPG